MKANNPLTTEFLNRYPVEAARVLEQVPTEHVVELLTSIPEETAKAVLIAMFPNASASCLGKMKIAQATTLLNNIPITRAARIFRLLNTEKQQELSATLPTRQRMRIKRILSYNTLSAGDFMNPNVNMLPDTLTVADAIRRIENSRQSIKCELYIVDQSHRFLGTVDLGKLLVSKGHIQLRDIVSRKLKPLSVHAGVEKILAHPGWASRHRLPVVDGENVLVGILDYDRIKGSADSDASIGRDPMENVISLAALFWLSMVQLLESLLNITAKKQQGTKR